MSNIPLVLPLRANEAAAVADLLYQQLEGKALTADARNRFAARLPQLALETFTPFAGSLARDPIHPSTYYLVVDTESASMLLRIALASSPGSGLFPGAMLIGRMRPGGGREIVINAVPFHFSDRENVRTFVEQVDPAFLPRAQGPLSAIVVEGGDFDSAFRGFRAILRATGLNLAAIAGDYDAALWSAIRAGWREGWNAQTSDLSAGEYTKFSVDGTLEQMADAYDRIQCVRAGRVFDFEIAVREDAAEALEWMRSRGKLVQFIRVGAEASALAGVARQFNAILSFEGATGTQLEQIGIATGGRFHYKMRGGEEDVRLAASCLLGRSV